MSIQSTPRRSVAKQAALARRLNVVTHIAQHVLDATIELEDEDREIIHRPGRYGDLFFVASRFPGRYYPVNYRNGVWSCSAADPQRYIGKCQRYLLQAVA